MNIQAAGKVISQVGKSVVKKSSAIAGKTTVSSKLLSQGADYFQKSVNARLTTIEKLSQKIPKLSELNTILQKILSQKPVSREEFRTLLQSNNPFRAIKNVPIYANLAQKILMENTKKAIEKFPFDKKSIAEAAKIPVDNTARLIMSLFK